MIDRRRRNSNQVMKLVVQMLKDNGPMTRYEIRSRLNLYGGTVVNSGINYLLLNGEISENSDSRLQA